MINVYMLPADEGDFLWVSYGMKKKHHILIDGGMESSGEEYSQIVNRICQREETIEAIILTHIDSDHLAGAIKGISLLSKETLEAVVKNIYFNTSRGYLRHEGNDVAKEGYAEDEVTVNVREEGYSVGEAIAFLELLKEKGIKDRLVDYVVAGQTIDFAEGASAKILSPDRKCLQGLSEKWENYRSKRQTFGYAPNLENVRKNLKDLMGEKLTYDNSINNAASIAFLFEYANSRIAFLGDALPGVCVKGWDLFKEEMGKKVDLVKISHHGSRSNTSDTLLKRLGTENYLLSTNGNDGKVPSKIVLAHLLKRAQVKDKKTVLMCNYAWWELAYHGNYFTEQDQKEYLGKKLILEELTEEGLAVKDGLIVYGEYD